MFRFEDTLSNNIYNSNDKFRESVKELAVTQIEELLKIFSEKYSFEKFVFANYWEGDMESIHSFSSFGSLEDNLFSDFILDENITQMYVEFFNGQKVEVKEKDKEFLELEIENLFTSYIGFDYYVEAERNKDGTYSASLVSMSIYE